MGRAPFLVLSIAASLAWPAGPPRPDTGQSSGLAALLRIHDEIREVEDYAGEAFIKWECFIGGPDDDDTNKDQHVVILIRRLDAGIEKMSITITALERSRSDRRVKFARGTKSLVCGIAGGAATLVSADRDFEPWAATAVEVLRAVIDKKRLLRGDRPV